MKFPLGIQAKMVRAPGSEMARLQVPWQQIQGSGAPPFGTLIKLCISKSAIYCN